MQTKLDDKVTEIQEAFEKRIKVLNDNVEGKGKKIQELENKLKDFKKEELKKKLKDFECLAAKVSLNSENITKLQKIKTTKEKAIMKFNECDFSTGTFQFRLTQVTSSWICCIFFDIIGFAFPFDVIL